MTRAPWEFDSNAYEHEEAIRRFDEEGPGLIARFRATEPGSAEANEIWATLWEMAGEWAEVKFRDFLDEDDV